MCIKNGKPIAFGVNKKRYSKNLSTFKCSCHAEIDLLRKIGNKAKGSKIYIYRFNNTSHENAREAKNAKPCILCQHVLKKAGVSKVYYVNDSGIVSVLKNRDMKSIKGEPHKITYRFLEENGDVNHGKFHYGLYVVQ